MKKTLAVLALAGVAFAAACGDMTTQPLPTPGGPSTAISDPVSPGFHTCPNTGVDGWTKIDREYGSASGSWGSLSYPKGNTITVNVNAGYVIEICVKSGSQVGGGDAIVYTVTGPEVNGTITIAQDISHTGFRLVDAPVGTNLSISKTAEASYDRTITWDLAKSVAPAVHNGGLGQGFESVWTVTATKHETGPANFRVSGTITITNPNAFEVEFEVSDVLSDGTVAEVTCPAYTVPAKVGSVNGSISCTYTASPSDAEAASNTATVTPIDAPEGVEGDEVTVPLVWTENVIGDEEVTLDDPRFDYSETISETTIETFEDSFTCSSNVTDYDKKGFLRSTHTNTATLTGDHTDITRTATVTVNCQINGCTPGFWQGGNGSQLWNTANDPQWNGLHTQPFTHATPFFGTTLFQRGRIPTTDISNSMTMFQIISTGGTSNNAQKAARSAIAAYLNASYGSGSAYSREWIVQQFNAAAAITNNSQRNNALHQLHNLLDAANNFGSCQVQ